MFFCIMEKLSCIEDPVFLKKIRFDKLLEILVQTQNLDYLIEISCDGFIKMIVFFLNKTILKE